MSEIKHVSPKDAAAWLAAGDAVFIDVRTTNEVVALNIAESEYLPVPLISEEKLQELQSDGKKMVFYCHSGYRSDRVVERFGTLNSGEMYSLAGGIAAWKKEGLETETISRVLSVERQTFIIAGFLILLFIFLGANVNKNFLAAAAFMGGGLMFAGLSGSCLMGLLLGLLPWNKQLKERKEK